MLKRDIKQVLWKISDWGFLGRQKMYLRIKMNARAISAIKLIGFHNFTINNIKIMNQGKDNRLIKIPNRR